MTSISIPSGAHVTLSISQLPPSYPAHTPPKPSFSTRPSPTASFKRALSSTTHLIIVRWIILFTSTVCLILDIIAVHTLLSRSHFLHSPSLTTSPPGSNGQHPKPSFFSLMIFRLVPDIMVISLMSMLLWKRIRLPNRLWSLHILCRVLFSTILMAFALFSPATELRLKLGQNQGAAVYFCQIRPLSYDGSLPLLQDHWAQNCAVLRARSILTFLWVFLLLVEICIAYRAKEFQTRESCHHKHEQHWSKARTDRLIKASMESSSDFWSSEEIVRGHDDDRVEVDGDGSIESGYYHDDDDYEETSTQYDMSQQGSNLQEHRYSYPPPEYHYAYRVEVLEPALPPFVYNPFMAQSDCSFTDLDVADSVTTASSITISSVDSLESRFVCDIDQNNDVSRPWHRGRL